LGKNEVLFKCNNFLAINKNMHIELYY